MKILLIAPIAPPFGGLATWTDEFVKATQGKAEVDCVNTNYPGKNPIETGRRSVTGELARAFGIWKAVWKKCKNTEYDVVHLNTPCSLFGNLRDGVTMLLVGLRRASKVNVLHCHCNLCDFVGDDKKRLWVFKAFLRRFDCVFVLNRQSLDYMKKISDAKAVYMPNFIGASEGGEKIYRPSDGGLRVLFSGRQTLLKGIDIFIRVAQTAKKNNDALTFQVIGNTSANMERFDELPDNLKIFGQLAHDEAMKMLRDADVLLFPSRTEGFPLAVLEAMMLGTPVISSDVGAVSQMLSGTGSIVLDSFDPADYYEALKKYLPTEVRQDIGARGKERYRKYFTPASVCDSILQEYEHLLNNVK